MNTEPRGDILNNSKYLIYIAVLFVAVLMISNTIAGKLIEIGPLVVSAAIIIFPISYIFGDILTEVYGYKASRRVVWSGLAALVLMSFMYWIVQILPGASFWQNQEAYNTILGAVPRIALASITAYFCGEFVNSYVLSKMKVRMNGNKLWMRTIGSTVVGEAVDTIVFYTIAFIGVLALPTFITLMISAYLIKVAYEIVITPVTYKIVGWLKRKEGIDVYDRGVNYNPFALAD